MIYKISNGEELKVLPLFLKNGHIVPYYKSTAIYDNGEILYDNNNIINELYTKCIVNPSFPKVVMMIKYNFLVEVNNEIRFIQVGKKLKNLFTEQNNLFGIKFRVIVDQRMQFNIYDNSYIISDEKWRGGRNDEEIFNYIKSKQTFFIEDWIDQRKATFDFFNKRFGVIFTDILNERREKKLLTILN